MGNPAKEGRAPLETRGEGVDQCKCEALVSCRALRRDMVDVFCDVPILHPRHKSSFADRSKGVFDLMASSLSVTFQR